MALAQLHEYGLLMAADSHLASVVTLVAGQPITGSWWLSSHGREIFAVMARIAAHPDVALARLINDKITYVERRLWSALVSAGTQEAPWQMDHLSNRAKTLLTRVKHTGWYLTTEARDAKAAGEAATELERVLLITAEDVHTKTGKHAKLLRSWAQWCASREFVPAKLDASAGRGMLDSAARQLPGSFSTRLQLPWSRTRRPRRSKRVHSV